MRLEEKSKILHQRLREIIDRLEGTEVNEDIGICQQGFRKIKFVLSELQKEKIHNQEEYEKLNSRLREYERKGGMLEQLNEELKKELEKNRLLRTELQELEHGGSFEVLTRKLSEIEEEIEKHQQRGRQQ